jgi:DNA-binding MarR family transcriptional regulator
MSEPSDRVAQIQAQWRVERPDLDVAPFGVVGRLHRLAAHLTDELVAVYRHHGLGEGDFDVLATLRRSGAPYELTPLEIAEQTMVTTGGMTKRVDRLEAAGLVTRRPSDRDGRSRVVALTPEGVRVIDDAFTDHMANERRLVDQLTTRQQAQLEGLLATWLAHYEPADPSSAGR